MQIAAYVRVSPDDQNEQRQMRTIREKYADPEQDKDQLDDWVVRGRDRDRRRDLHMRNTGASVILFHCAAGCVIY